MIGEQFLPGRGLAISSRAGNITRAAGLAVLALSAVVASSGAPKEGDFTANAASVPSRSINATFFYDWFGNPEVDGAWIHWNEAGHVPPDDPASHLVPSRGLYSSRDRALIDWQFSEMGKAKQDAALVSWWGPGSREDVGLKQLFEELESPANPYPDLKLAVHYELESKSDPSVSTLVDHLNYIKTNYASRPGYLKVDGRPVVFVFGDGVEGFDMAKRWGEARSKTGFYTSLKVRGWQAFAKLGWADSYYQYSPGNRIVNLGKYSTTISPGYWPYGSEQPILSRDIEEYRAAIAQMKASNSRWNLTFWNEGHEGTNNEPTLQYGEDYVMALNEGLAVKR